MIKKKYALFPLPFFLILFVVIWLNPPNIQYPYYNLCGGLVHVSIKMHGYEICLYMVKNAPLLIDFIM